MKTEAQKRASKKLHMRLYWNDPVYREKRRAASKKYNHAETMKWAGKPWPRDENGVQYDPRKYKPPKGLEGI